MQGMQNITRCRLRYHHQLLIAKFKIKLKTSRRKPTTLRFDLSSITNVFTVAVSNRFDALLDLDEEFESDRLWNMTKGAILESAKESVRKPTTKKVNRMLS